MEGFTFFLLIAAICILTVAKIIAQRKTARLYTRTPIDTVRMIALFFFFTSLAFLPMLVLSPPSSAAILYAIPAAILNLSFQVFYTLALSRGPAGLTVLFSNLSMLIPLLGATFFLGEGFGLFRILGLVLTFAALVLNTDFRKGGNGLSRSWVSAMVLTFLSNGLATFWQKVFARSRVGTEVAAYGFFSYFIAAILAAILLLCLGRKKELRPSAPVSRGLVGGCALVGLFLGGFQWLFTYSQRVLEASLLLPIYNGATTVLMTLIGILFFKETLTKRRLAATVVGVAAIALFSIVQ